MTKCRPKLNDLGGLHGRVLRAAAKLGEGGREVVGGLSNDPSKVGWVLLSPQPRIDEVAHHLNARGFFVTMPRSGGERYVVPMPDPNVILIPMPEEQDDV